MFSPVTYMNQDEVHAMLREVTTNIKVEAPFLRTLERKTIAELVIRMLLATVTCTKHDGFAEEREWRAIFLHGATWGSAEPPLMFPSTQVINHVPQLIYQIPIDETVSDALGELDLTKIFDRLIIGPSPYPWVMYGAFVDALTQAGVPDAASRVRVSEIPLRM